MLLKELIRFYDANPGDTALSFKAFTAHQRFHILF